MREINVQDIADDVARLCIKANESLPKSLEECIENCSKQESSKAGKQVFLDLLENMQVAREISIPICQDTGMAVVFVEIGQEVHLVGGDLEEYINRGVAKGYTQGYLRCSIVEDPLRRVNTGDNTPAVIHTRIVPGDRVRITVAPKGFGSENMSALKMFTPSASEGDIVSYVTDVVKLAGSNPCPPIVVGVGIGGDFEYSAILAKRALCRDVSKRNADKFYEGLEMRMLDSINSTDIGPQGFGGDITALAVNIEQFPTHIAGLPVAVNIGCHVTRHASVEI
ncbi:MAG TPA: fumarate hydratase [Oscillospiraceae bacterium]|nr:fumarate hydratase [Oscillospiraceae bacterium]